MAMHAYIIEEYTYSNISNTKVHLAISFRKRKRLHKYTDTHNQSDKYISPFLNSPASSIRCRRSLPTLVRLSPLRVCPLEMQLQGPSSFAMLVQGPPPVPSSPLSPRPRSAGDVRDATQSAAISPSVLCVSMTTSGTARCVGDHIAIPGRYYGNPISSFLRARLVSGCRFLGRCWRYFPRRCHQRMSRRTEEGMDNHPTPSAHRADSNHRGRSTTEGSAVELRIPDDIGRTLGTRRVGDSRR